MRAAALLALLLLCWPADATVVLQDRVLLWLNKPQIRLAKVPPRWLDGVRKKLGADEIRLSIERGVPLILLVKRPQERAKKLSTSLDLRRWFVHKECLGDWERFDACLQNQSNRADEALYRRLEREFYAKVACQESCEEADFVKWRIRWPAPAFMTLEAGIGEEGGFKNLDAARASLRRVNALLKRALYGARFPEDFGEGTSEYEVFALDTVRVDNYDFKKALHRLLWRLKEAGYLKEIARRDIEAIDSLVKKGWQIYYIPKACVGGEVLGKKGWYAVPLNARVRFDSRLCPRVRVTR